MSGDLWSYPVDVEALLSAEPFSLNDYEVPLRRDASVYHPVLIAQYGLVSWNRYLADRDECWREAFLQQARWLIEHEVRIGDDAGGWPVRLLHTEDGNACCLSCVAQGNGLSVLVRAYQLTHEELFLKSRGVLCALSSAISLMVAFARPLGRLAFFLKRWRFIRQRIISAVLCLPSLPSMTTSRLPATLQ